MWIVRNTRRPSIETLAKDHVCQPVETLVEVERVVPVLPTDRYETARLTYIESLSEGKQRVGRRPLMSRWGLEQREAEEIITEVEKERTQAIEAKSVEVADSESVVPPPGAPFDRHERGRAPERHEGPCGIGPESRMRDGARLGHSSI